MTYKLIYLAGAITGLTDEEMNGWRYKITQMIDAYDFDGVRWKCINPCPHIPPQVDDKVEEEQMRWDLYKVRTADLIVCDFDHPNSIGTSFELSLAKELHIPIIGLQTNPNVALHPWWRMSAIHICTSIDELQSYLMDNFLCLD